MKPICPKCGEAELHENRFSWRVVCEHCNAEFTVNSLSQFAQFFLGFAEEERQMLLLGLAELGLSRPGWDHMLREMAQKISGLAMYEEFQKANADRVHVQRGPLSANYAQANYIQEIRPNPAAPPCHVCGALTVPSAFKCNSCGATTEAK